MCTDMLKEIPYEYANAVCICKYVCMHACMCRYAKDV